MTKKWISVFLTAVMLAAPISAAEESYIDPQENLKDSASKKIEGDGLYVAKDEEELEDNAMIRRPENYEDPTPYSKIIMIGDSRTVGLSQVCTGPQGTSIVWSCKGSMGYDWMVSTGIPQIEGYVDGDTAIVVLMGVNDTYNVQKYIGYMNDKVLDWEMDGADTYFCTVGPLGTGSKYVSNNQVIDFNNALKDGLSSDITIIDLFSYMDLNGFETFDGVHYSVNTNHDMFEYVLENLVNDNGGVPGSIW